MVRRTSSSKMYHTLSVEAPITKVIHILMSARESSPLYIAQALDKVQKASKNAFLKVQLNYLPYNTNTGIPRLVRFFGPQQTALIEH